MKWRPVEDRFWEKVDKTGSCWLWRGAKSCGYGKITIQNRPRWAHRVSYELANGPITDGLKVDHVCRERSCVRPDHLRLVTHKQNLENSTGRALPSNKSSGVRGVWWNTQKSKWQARVEHLGRQHHVGFFEDLSEAAAAVLHARIQLFTHNDVDRNAVA